MLKNKFKNRYKKSIQTLKSNKILNSLNTWEKSFVLDVIDKLNFLTNNQENKLLQIFKKYNISEGVVVNNIRIVPEEVNNFYEKITSKNYRASKAIEKSFSGIKNKR